MSGVYAYCLLSEARRPPDGLGGLADRPVTALELEGLTVWVSEAEEPPKPDLDAVRRHHAVVSAALGSPVLPLRFGAWHPDASSLAGLIRGSSSELAAGLVRVAGRVELGIRIVGPVSPPEPQEAVTPGEPVSGRAYLRALSRRRDTRVERRRAQDDVARQLQACLGEVAVEQRVEYLSPPELVSVAHLVEPANEGRYRELAAAFARNARGELVVHVTGPWPPYSFAR